MIKKTTSTILIMLFAIAAYSQKSYVLSPDSGLTISGTSTVHDWTVRAKRMNGTLRADEKVPAAIIFEVDVAQIKSERGATMDKKMHAALQKEEHPKVVFDLKEVQSGSTLLGTLTVAGVSQDVAIDCQILPSQNTIKLNGKYDITLQDFDIEPPTAMFGQVIVGDDITVHFDLVFESDD